MYRLTVNLYVDYQIIAAELIEGRGVAYPAADDGRGDSGHEGRMAVGRHAVVELASDRTVGHGGLLPERQPFDGIQNNQPSGAEVSDGSAERGEIRPLR
jgi:hypothetical protein